VIQRRSEQRSGAAVRLGMGCMAALLVLWGPATTWAADGSVELRVLEDTGNRIVLSYRFGDFKERPVSIDGQSFVELDMGREALLKRVGEPALPHVCRSVLIPDDADMAVRVLESRYYEVPEVAVAPSKGFLLRSVNPDDVPYTFGDVYSADGFYPGTLAGLRDPHILRDCRGVVVEVFPFQWNPVSRTLRVYTELAIEVYQTGPGTVNVLERVAGRGPSRAFHQIYPYRFVNYREPERYAPLDEEGDMLIIVHDAWAGNVQPLADHKTSVGINATVVPVSTIGNNATSIKNYIQNVYNTSDLAFVLLVGDSAQVATPSASGGAADPTYAKVAGSDDYPDIFVGRFSAETAAHVDTQVLRTIQHETLPATTQNWYWRATGIASAEGGSSTGDDGESDIQHMNNIRTELLGYNYTLVDQIYDPGASASSVTSALNAGRGLVNYTGHGSTTAWSTTGFSSTNVNALSNVGLLPFICSVACVNGNFAGSTCFAEAWLRATSGEQPSGAVAVYMSSINQSWAPPMEGQDEFNHVLATEQYVTFGGLCFAGSCSMMDKYGSGGVSMFNTWHIFGDPSLRVVGTVAPPTGLGVSPGQGLESEGDEGGPFTPVSITYTLENHNATPIGYSVAATADWVDVSNATGTLPGLGTAMVTVSINAAANDLTTGDYIDTVSFVNTTDGDGNTTRTVKLGVGVPRPVYVFNMDTNPGWTTQGLWAWGQPTGGGGAYGNPDPTSGYTGLNVYGYNLNGDYTNSMSEMHLTSTAIDCTGLSTVSLKFWRWLGVERSTYDRAYVRVSNNGTTWTTIWQNPDEHVTDSTWVPQEFDISAIADGQPTVYLRWTMGTTDSGWTYCGWNIDDVEIWGRVAGDMPPTAYDGSVTTDTNTPIEVTLEAYSSSGNPLAFILTGLPAHGQLRDPGAGHITAVPYTLVDGGNKVTFVPTLGYAGPDSFRFKVNDGEDSNEATISVTVGGPRVLFSFPMDANPGWTTQGQWAFGQPTGGGGAYGNADPTSGATGLNVYGYNLSGDYSTAIGGPYALTAGPFDLSNATEVALKYQRWLNSDYTPYVYQRVEVSNNGSQWTTVWSNGSSSIADSTWSLQTHDVSAVADGQSAVYIRWTHQVGQSGAWAYSGWNIDDVAIWGVAAAATGDIDEDGDVDLADFAGFQECCGVSPLSAECERLDMDGDGLVTPADLPAFVGNLELSGPA